MSPTWIEVDDEVLAKISAGAEAFVDSPNDVLRKLLALAPSRGARCAQHPRSEPARGGRASGPRVLRGEGLPMPEYELPLLRALSQLGGSAPRRRIIEAVKPMLVDRLSKVDHSHLRNGEERWENRLAFVRLRAVERGYIHSNSRRGIWELTEAPIGRLGQLETELQERERTASR